MHTIKLETIETLISQSHKSPTNFNTKKAKQEIETYSHTRDLLKSGFGENLNFSNSLTIPKTRGRPKVKVSGRINTLRVINEAKNALKRVSAEVDVLSPQQGILQRKEDDLIRMNHRRDVNEFYKKDLVSYDANDCKLYKHKQPRKICHRVPKYYRDKKW